jgi:hypothetical protein
MLRCGCPDDKLTRASQDGKPISLPFPKTRHGIGGGRVQRVGANYVTTELLCAGFVGELSSHAPRHTQQHCVSGLGGIPTLSPLPEPLGRTLPHCPTVAPAEKGGTNLFAFACTGGRRLTELSNNNAARTRATRDVAVQKEATLRHSLHSTAPTAFFTRSAAVRRNPIIFPPSCGEQRMVGL